MFLKPKQGKNHWDASLGGASFRCRVGGFSPEPRLTGCCMISRWWISCFRLINDLYAPQPPRSKNVIRANQAPWPAASRDEMFYIDGRHEPASHRPFRWCVVDAVRFRCILELRGRFVAEIESIVAHISIALLHCQICPSFVYGNRTHSHASCHGQWPGQVHARRGTCCPLRCV